MSEVNQYRHFVTLLQASRLLLLLLRVVDHNVLHLLHLLFTRPQRLQLLPGALLLLLAQALLVQADLLLVLQAHTNTNTNTESVKAHHMDNRRPKQSKRNERKDRLIENVKNQSKVCRLNGNVFAGGVGVVVVVWRLGGLGQTTSRVLKSYRSVDRLDVLSTHHTNIALEMWRWGSWEWVIRVACKWWTMVIDGMGVTGLVRGCCDVVMW